MQVDSTTAIQNNTTQTSDTTKKTSGDTLDYTAFLRLLIAEMKNQDPTNPADPAQWMGQIASFSNVEQGIQTNAKLDSLLTASALSQADAVLGHTVTSEDGATTGVVESLRITSDGLVAKLQNGEELALGQGVTIS